MVLLCLLPPGLDASTAWFSCSWSLRLHASRCRMYSVAFSSMLALLILGELDSPAEWWAMCCPSAPSVVWCRRLGILSRSSAILSLSLVRYRFSIALWVLRRGLFRPSGALAALCGNSSVFLDFGDRVTQSLLNAGDGLCRVRVFR